MQLLVLLMVLLGVEATLEEILRTMQQQLQVLMLQQQQQQQQQMMLPMQPARPRRRPRASLQVCRI